MSCLGSCLTGQRQRASSSRKLPGAPHQGLKQKTSQRPSATGLTTTLAGSTKQTISTTTITTNDDNQKDEEEEDEEEEDEDKDHDNNGLSQSVHHSKCFKNLVIAARTAKVAGYRHRRSPLQPIPINRHTSPPSATAWPPSYSYYKQVLLAVTVMTSTRT